MKKTTKPKFKPTKGFIKKMELIKDRVGEPLVLPGEPMLYSVKYSLGERRHSVQYFRDKKFRSFLKCWFPTYTNVKTPVALIICFYVTPKLYHGQKIPLKDLRSEKVPAVYGWEVIDYMLSFLEMLRGVLLSAYPQIVKLDIMKFYSDNPRTVFQFMHWGTYVNVQNNYPLDAKAESVVSSQPRQNLQPKRERHGVDDQAGEDEPASGLSRADAIRAATSCRTLPVSPSKSSIAQEKAALAYFTTCMSPGRGQSREVFERRAAKSDVEG